jgi:hypothetical protein
VLSLGDEVFVSCIEAPELVEQALDLLPELADDVLVLLRGVPRIVELAAQAIDLFRVNAIARCCRPCLGQLALQGPHGRRLLLQALGMFSTNFGKRRV